MTDLGSLYFCTMMHYEKSQRHLYGTSDELDIDFIEDLSDDNYFPGGIITYLYHICACGGNIKAQRSMDVLF